jgi:hypothetical protein
MPQADAATTPGGLVLSPPFAGGVPPPDAPDVTLAACGLGQREKLVVKAAVQA